MKRILLWLSVGVIVMIVMGCRSLKTTVIQSVRHDTVYVSRVGYDSIYVVDSSTEHFVPTDSIFPDSSPMTGRLGGVSLIKERLKKEYRYKMLHDTMYVMKIDTIRAPLQLPRGEEDKNTPLGGLGGLLAGLGLLTILVTLIVLIIKLSK